MTKEGPHSGKTLGAVCIGECMIELARGGDGRFGQAVGGDSFNTAVYLARAGIGTAYVTALGDDPYSQAILDTALSERVETSAVARLPGRVPGLYLIETDAAGERHFHYWRETSPARDIFLNGATDGVRDCLFSASLVYFSGVTLWLYTKGGLDTFLSLLAEARSRGAAIAFDTNYRPRLWGGDAHAARAAFASAIALSDIVLPSLDDDRLLWSDATAQGAHDRYASAGVKEIVIKDGAAGVTIGEGGGTHHIPPPAAIVPIDTTAAGDSFNAGYLAARLKGQSQSEAAAIGHRLSGIVISHRGAIVPASATAGLLNTLGSSA